jgi:hypothetical protein
VPTPLNECCNSGEDFVSLAAFGAHILSEPADAKSTASRSSSSGALALAVWAGLRRLQPDHAGFHYNQACFATFAGDTGDETFGHVRRSVESLSARLHCMKAPAGEGVAEKQRTDRGFECRRQVDPTLCLAQFQ